MIKERIKHQETQVVKSYSSLKLTMLSTLLFALGVAILLFIGTNFLADRYIDYKYLSAGEREKRVEAYKDDLQKYVTDNGLSCDDTKEISKWAQAHKYLYVLIYQDDKLLFESGQYEEEEKTPENDTATDGSDDLLDTETPDTDETPDADTDSGEGSTDNTDPEEGDGTPDTDSGEVDEPKDPDSEDDPNGEESPEGGEGAEGGADDEPNKDEPAKNETAEKPEGDNKNENKYPSSGITVKTPSRDELIAEAVAGGSHPIIASDGVLLASMVDYTEYLYYDIVNIVSVILAFVGFLLVMWIYFFEITKRITRLAREVTAVADGDMNRTITQEGEDEITRLCTDVEYMRSSMLENIEKERAALEANRELITAMSHDIRTPLTVLLGYIDIMKLNAPEGDMQQYIEASERTALRLKKMSDDMFSYFLVYGGGIEVSVQECDARTLIDQMLSGHVFLLREQGYAIDFNFECEDNDFLSDVIVVTDPPQLMRIVENIFSNIMKYADVEKPVTVFVGAEVDELTIKVCNYIRPNPDEAQKNGIGLRSCMKLANAMDVRFSSVEEEGVFTSLMYVPIIPTIEYTDDDGFEEIGGIVGWLRSILSKLKRFFVGLWKRIATFFKGLMKGIRSFFARIFKRKNQR